MIYLIESHTIKPTNPHYKELDNICFLSKNLYNAELYNQTTLFRDKNILK